MTYLPRRNFSHQYQSEDPSCFRDSRGYLDTPALLFDNTPGCVLLSTSSFGDTPLKNESDVLFGDGEKWENPVSISLRNTVPDGLVDSRSIGLRKCSPSLSVLEHLSSRGLKMIIS